MSRGRKVYEFGDISGIDSINDRIPILDMSQSGEARDKLISPANLILGASIDTSSFVTTGQTGDFYPRSNPSGYITGVNLSNYSTISFVTGVSGYLQDQIDTIGSPTGDFLLRSESGAFYPTNNPSGYITGVDLSLYSTNSFTTGISGYLQSEINLLNGITGDFVQYSETGAFYPNNNPNGFITGVDLSSYATQSYVSGISGTLNSDIELKISITDAHVSFINITGNESVSGVKNFYSRPTVNGTGVLLSGEESSMETGFLTGYVSKTESGAFYPNSNPSGFITGDFSLYASLVYTNTVSGNLQSGINNLQSNISFQKVSGKMALEVFYTGSSLGFLQLSASPI